MKVHLWDDGVQRIAGVEPESPAPVKRTVCGRSTNRRTVTFTVSSVTCAACQSEIARRRQREVARAADNTPRVALRGHLGKTIAAVAIEHAERVAATDGARDNFERELARAFVEGVRYAASHLDERELQQCARDGQ